MTRKKKRKPKPTLGDQLVEDVTEKLNDLLWSFVSPPSMPEMTIQPGLKRFNGYDQL